MGDTTAWNATNSSILSQWDFLKNMSIYADFLLCKTCLFISPSRSILTFLKKWIGSSLSNYNHSHTGKKKTTLVLWKSTTYVSAAASRERNWEKGQVCMILDAEQQTWIEVWWDAIHSKTCWKEGWCQLAQRCCATPWDDGRAVRLLRRSLKLMITFLYAL